MAARPKLLGECGDGFVRTWAANAPRDGAAAKGRKPAQDRKRES
jgi:hypothetical protein